MSIDDINEIKKELAFRDVFSKRIKTIRESKKLTLKEVADKMGVTPQSYWAYENNKVSPKPQTIKRIKEALDCSDYDLGIISTPWGVELVPDNFEDIDKKAVFGYNIPTTVNYKEYNLLSHFNNLSEEGQQKVIAYASDLAENPKYKK